MGVALLLTCDAGGGIFVAEAEGGSCLGLGMTLVVVGAAIEFNVGVMLRCMLCTLSGNIAVLGDCAFA